MAATGWRVHERRLRLSLSLPIPHATESAHARIDHQEISHDPYFQAHRDDHGKCRIA